MLTDERRAAPVVLKSEALSGVLRILAPPVLATHVLAPLVAGFRQHYPVIVLDVEMPRMDGFELARVMRSDARLKSVPIIMITSRTADKHRNRAMEIGVNVYLGKPYQEQQLLDAIAEQLKQEAAVPA